MSENDALAGSTEAFWRGAFGDDYTVRNQGAAWLVRNLAFFVRALGCRAGITRVLELGCNRGMSLQALALLLPTAELHGVEINARACAHARALGIAQIHEGSLLDLALPVVMPPGVDVKAAVSAPPLVSEQPGFDLVFTKGVLIHLAPRDLPRAYDQLYTQCRRYLLLAEYYHPTPQELPYRGYSGKLFKRDFAGELLDRHPDLHLCDYGFCYHRDPHFAQDDLSWFLLERTFTR